MSFFLNPFAAPDFIGCWVLGDRQHSPEFRCPRNAGRGTESVTSYGQAPFNLSGNDLDGNSKSVLTISFALNEKKNWADIPVTISASSLAATTVQEVISSLQSNATFTSFFTVSSNSDGTSLTITQKKPVTSMIFYIKKGRAETVLNFNKYAGVAEMPTYFSRHTIENRYTYVDGQNALILLDTNLNVDSDLIDNAVNERGVSKGFDSGTVQEDWQLLKGKSGIFNFQKVTVDGSDRITEIIEYPTGAIAGDLARKIEYAYSGSNKNPDKITEIPYTLTGSDLVTP